MSDYMMGVTLDRPYDATVDAVRESLAEQGFGVLTEIDVTATLKTKLDAPSIGVLLPCNVVIRDIGGATAVQAVDPGAMMRLADDATLREVATEARERLAAALAALEGAC